MHMEELAFLEQYRRHTCSGEGQLSTKVVQEETSTEKSFCAFLFCQSPPLGAGLSCGSSGVQTIRRGAAGIETSGAGARDRRWAGLRPDLVHLGLVQQRPQPLHRPHRLLQRHRHVREGVRIHVGRGQGHPGCHVVIRDHLLKKSSLLGLPELPIPQSPFPPNTKNVDLSGLQKCWMRGGRRKYST